MAPSYKKWIVLCAIGTALEIAEGICWWNFGSFDMATTQLKYSAMICSMINLMLMLCYIQSPVKKVADKSIPKAPAAVGRFLKLVGDDSFGIYLSHILTMTVLRITLYEFLPKIFPVDVLILLAIEVVGMEIFKRVFKKYPKFRKWVGLA